MAIAGDVDRNLDFINNEKKELENVSKLTRKELKVTIADLIKYTKDNEQKDPFMNATIAKENPLMTKKKCGIL